MNRITSLLCCNIIAALTATLTAQTVIEYSVENRRVSDFLASEPYEPSDESHVYDYLPQYQVRCDQPMPAVITVKDPTDQTLTLMYSDHQLFAENVTTVSIAPGTRSINVWNLIPGRTYYYYLLSPNSTIIDYGRIMPKGKVRMVYTPHLYNIRDLGGWVNEEGRAIRYGMLFRGCELNGNLEATEEDLDILRGLGVAAEIDMRIAGESDSLAGISAFNFKTSKELPNNEIPTYLYTNNSGCCELNHLTGYSWRMRYRQEFEFIVKNMREGRPVYFHCVWGADRTGMLAFLLEGLLGIPYDGLMKDFELTAFYKSRHKDLLDFAYEYINSLDGDRLSDKFYNYFVKYLYSKPTDIQYFREQMLEPLDVTTAINSLHLGGDGGGLGNSLPLGGDGGGLSVSGRKATQKGIIVGKGKKYIKP